MLFKKNKKKEATPQFISNLDCLPVIDPVEKVFLSQFTPEQEEAILYGLDRGYPVRVYAYADLPANFMHLIIDCIYKEPKGPANVREIDVWKLVHTDLNYNQMKWCLIALTFGLSIVDYVPNLKQYDAQIIELLAEGSVYGLNLCDELSPGMYFDSFAPKVREKIERSRKKHKNNEALRHFLYS